MKKILILTLITLGMNSIQAQEINSIEAEGNLESSNPCGCVALSEVTNEHTPADILTGMGKCIELKDFVRATIQTELTNGAKANHDRRSAENRFASQHQLFRFSKEVFAVVFIDRHHGSR